MIGESTAHKRSSNRGNTVHGSNYTGVDWTLDQGYGVCHDHKRSCEDAGRSKTSNGPANNESNGVWCHAANERPHFEDANGCQVHPCGFVSLGSEVLISRAYHLML